MLALLLCLAAALAASAVAGSAAAAGGSASGRTAATPGTPVAQVPSGTVSGLQPTFTWSAAHGAKTYQVRILRDGDLVLTKTGITGLSWTAGRPLPQGVPLTWSVRGRNAHGAGRWSAPLSFTIAAGSAKALTAFSFQGLVPPVVGAIDETAHTVSLTVPSGTVVTALVATFATTGASVGVDGVPQVSGVTPNDFTHPVTYTVTAANGSTQAYVVTVAVTPPSAAKEITGFSFAHPAATGVIDQTRHTVAVTVPYGTNVTALVPTITITGTSVSPASGVARDFSHTVVYTVTAADGSMQAYFVTVRVTGSPDKAITAFGFIDPLVVGEIDQGMDLIRVTVPAGTDVDDLVANFSFVGKYVTVGDDRQHTGETANDFTLPVTYIVTALDGSTRSYLVMVDVGPPPAVAYTVTLSGGWAPLWTVPQTVGRTFTVRVAAVDEHGQLVSDFTGVVALTSNAFAGEVVTAITRRGCVDGVPVTPTVAGTDRFIGAEGEGIATDDASGPFVVLPGP